MGNEAIGCMNRLKKKIALIGMDKVDDAQFKTLYLEFYAVYSFVTTEHNPLIAHWSCYRPDSTVNESPAGLEGSTFCINCI